MKSLIWSAGKFVYPKGSSLPVHFMPLQDFSLEISLNYSLLIALRVARTEKRDELLSKIEVGQWRNRLLTNEITKMIVALPFVTSKFHEIGGSSGLVLEEVKLAWTDQEVKPTYQIFLDDTESRARLNALHPEDEWRCQVKPFDTFGASLEDRSVIIVNSVLGVRSNYDPLPPLEKIEVGAAQGCVLALRASSEDSDCMRTTVYGRDVRIPSVKQVEAWMRSTKLNWRHRWLPDHDVDFFLPEIGAVGVGVLLAYGDTETSLTPGFRLLNS